MAPVQAIWARDNRGVMVRVLGEPGGKMIYVETENSDHSGLLTSKQISQIQTKGRDVMSLLLCYVGIAAAINGVAACRDVFASADKT